MNQVLARTALLLFIANLGVGAIAEAGTRDGGGGIGVRCPASTGAPKAFELLDLHEARINGLKLGVSAPSYMAAVNLDASLFSNLLWTPEITGQTLPDFKAGMAEIFRPALNEQSGGMFSIQTVPNLPLSNDTGTYQILPGCSLEQIAYYDDTAGALSIADNWNELEWIDRAALMAHEYAYFFNRHFGMEYIGAPGGMTSKRAREFVGELFSGTGVKAHAGSLPAIGYAVCDSGTKNSDNRTRFYAFDDGSGNLTAVFDFIHARGSMYEMKASFAGVKLKDLFSHRGQKLTFSGPLVFTGEPNVPSFVMKFTSENDGATFAFDITEDEGGQPAPVENTQTIECVPQN